MEVSSSRFTLSSFTPGRKAVVSKKIGGRNGHASIKNSFGSAVGGLGFVRRSGQEVSQPRSDLAIRKPPDRDSGVSRRRKRQIGGRLVGYILTFVGLLLALSLIGIQLDAEENDRKIRPSIVPSSCLNDAECPSSFYCKFEPYLKGLFVFKDSEKGQCTCDALSGFSGEQCEHFDVGYSIAWSVTFVLCLTPNYIALSRLWSLLTTCSRQPKAKLAPREKLAVSALFMILARCLVQFLHVIVSSAGGSSALLRTHENTVLLGPLVLLKYFQVRVLLFSLLPMWWATCRLLPLVPRSRSLRFAHAICPRTGGIMADSSYVAHLQFIFTFFLIVLIHGGVSNFQSYYPNRDGAVPTPARAYIILVAKLVMVLAVYAASWVHCFALWSVLRTQAPTPATATAVAHRLHLARTPIFVDDSGPLRISPAELAAFVRAECRWAQRLGALLLVGELASLATRHLDWARAAGEDPRRVNNVCWVCLCYLVETLQGVALALYATWPCPGGPGRGLWAARSSTRAAPYAVAPAAAAPAAAAAASRGRGARRRAPPVVSSAHSGGGGGGAGRGRAPAGRSRRRAPVALASSLAPGRPESAVGEGEGQAGSSSQSLWSRRSPAASLAWLRQSRNRIAVGPPSNSRGRSRSRWSGSGWSQHREFVSEGGERTPSAAAPQCVSARPGDLPAAAAPCRARDGDNALGAERARWCTREEEQSRPPSDSAGNSSNDSSVQPGRLLLRGATGGPRARCDAARSVSK